MDSGKFLQRTYRYSGPRVVHRFLEEGHEVTLFHRGETNDKRTEGAAEILGDRKDIFDFWDQFRAIEPEVVLDMIPFREEDAANLMEVFDGITPRVVALSSGSFKRSCFQWWPTEGIGDEPPPDLIQLGGKG